MAEKPKFVNEMKDGITNIEERKGRTENYYSLIILIKIAEKFTHEKLPSSVYSVRYFSDTKSRKKYFQRLLKDGWIQWIDGPQKDKKKSGWIPTKNGLNVIKLISKLQDESSPILSLEAFRDIPSIDKGIFS